MNILERFGHAFHNFFTGLFGTWGDDILTALEDNSGLINAAKPVVADIQKIVPDTKVAIEVAQNSIRNLLSHHFTAQEAAQWIEDHLHLNVGDLLRAAAAKIISNLPQGKEALGSAINLAIEVALAALRV
jgi:phage-related minor tail protein